MNNYKKGFWTSNIIILILAVVLTVIVKFSLMPFFISQQDSLASKLDLRNVPIITTYDQLNATTTSNQLAYLKVSNPKLTTPLIYVNNNLPLLTFLFEIPSTSIFSQEGQQIIEYRAANYNLLQAVTQIFIALYGGLILISLFINSIYYNIFKGIEKTLIQEISSDENPKDIPFTKVSEQLQEQKKLFHRSLMKQEQQISLLARQINMDNLTGLNNRQAFRKTLTEILNEESEQTHAVLFILRASELNAINSQRGFQHGDEYIISIANILNNVTEKLSSISLYRVSGSDFAIIALGMSIPDAQRVAKNLKIQFDQYQMLNKLDSTAYSGISSIISGQLPEQVLARTDMALAKAQISGVNSWHFEQNDSVDDHLGQQHWRVIIEDVIAKRALMLLHQPIQALHRNMKGYQEIFTRFLGENNNMIPTDTIFAMAQRLDMIVKLEQLILETVVSQCRHKTDGNVRWGVNLTGTAIQNSSFIVWLERLLLREPNIAACLIFEMQEEILDSNLVVSKRVFDMLKRTGTRSAICKFGKGVGSFRLFKELNPDFVKIDASLINNIEHDSANQQFVRMIIDVAHRMDCKVIAEGIEHLAQKQTLEAMYVDGIQGFLIARPSPF
jgi:diguanylate cyclase (GGDEF)-like protein